MRKLISVLLMGFIVIHISAQNSVFSEDFEGSLSTTTYTGSGSGNSFAINTNLSANGTKSVSAAVLQMDTVFLESSTFSTNTFSFVTLSFNQICKIDFFDAAIVQVSIDNGSTWTNLTSAEYNGSGIFPGNKFSSISYTQWNPGNGSLVPDNTWWRSESFDISNIAGNQSQVRVRFALIDVDNNGAINNYGWVIDDIVVNAAGCELIPPTIALSGTIYQGQIYFTGPYQIEANIQDASGIANATLTYTINGGAVNNRNMVNTTGNIFTTTIPSATVNDTICYTINATDATTCANSSSLPSIGCTEFIVKSNPPPSCNGTPIFNFTYNETFAAFTPGNGNNVGALINNWINDNSDSHDWYVLNRATNSGATGPSADHSINDANYLYIEASGHTAETAILNTPCYDFSNLLSPKFRFYYHMYGATMGELHLDIFFGGQWVADVMPAIIGDQGDQWFFREVDLSAYAGNIVKLRFRGIVGSSFTSDIAIDDIEIFEPIANDIYLSDIVSPFPTGCSGSATEFITVELSNLGGMAQNRIPLAYRVNSGTIIRDTATFTLSSNAVANHTFQQTVNMSSPGSYTFDIWTELPMDGNLTNDSILSYTVASSLINTNFPDTTNFENFVVGNPGTFQDGWVNDISDSYDWRVHSGVTPSANTGPAGDHTTGSGNYLYLEASNANNLEAALQSKCYDIQNLNEPKIAFYYHMLGGNMGDLHIDININGFILQDIIPVISGDQGNLWKVDTIDLTPYKGVVKIIFRGIIGNGFQSDIALDDIVVWDARPVGISNKVISQKINVFPNPSSSSIQIQGLSLGSQFEIRNLLGKLINIETVVNNNITLDVSKWPKGVYFLTTIANDNKKSTEKIIVN